MSSNRNIFILVIIKFGIALISIGIILAIYGSVNSKNNDASYNRIQGECEKI